TELVADPPVEAGAGQLGEAAGGVDEADLELFAGGELAELVAVEGDFDRLAGGRVADREDVGRRDHQGSRGQRVRGDVADHVPLHPPGQDRPLVGEVVAGRADRGGGNQPVAADVSDLVGGDPVAQLGDPVVQATREGDVVEADAAAAAGLDPDGGQLDRLDPDVEGTADPGLRVSPLDRGQETHRAEV